MFLVPTFFALVLLYWFIGLSGVLRPQLCLYRRSLNPRFCRRELRFFFSLTLLTIFFCITAFCFRYFKTSTDYMRFFFFLVSFFSSILVFINHYRVLTLFIGWDGLGVTSYILVKYYLNWKATNGALTTVLTNRIGDACLFFYFVSFISYASPQTTFFGLSLVPLVLSIGAFTKRAQVPFRSWLPIAIRAPTPVSALVHSSTLVTAGVFLLLKYIIFFIYAQTLLVLVGFITMLVSGLIACTERDIKKVIAFSTISQLGFIIYTLGISLPLLCLIHLLTHAFFKRCIFIQIGSFIESNHGGQDGRRYSKLWHRDLISTTLFIICRFRLCGLFYTSGFVSKDNVVATSAGLDQGLVSRLFLLPGLGLTFLYSTRVTLTLLGTTENSVKPHMSTPRNLFVSTPLILGGVLGGWFFTSNGISIIPQICYIEKRVLFLIVSFLLLVVSRTSLSAHYSYTFNSLGGMDTIYKYTQFFLSPTNTKIDNMLNTTLNTFFFFFC
jgi:NADH-ubiquinone oxidoreductase chain 5